MSAHLVLPVSARDHALGPADAPVTLVKYGDYECPHCARAHPVVRQLRAHLGDRLRFVFRNFPLTEIHRHAEHAAEAAEAVAALAGEDAFWAMHDRIYEHQGEGLGDHALAAHAAALGVDGDAVLREIRGETHLPRIREDFMSGVRSGVNGTPTFYVNGARFDDDWSDVHAFARALEAAAAPSR
ncbi:MAG: DsbA family protein [Gemmatimonadaceae bacterium]|jgi:protein-disulfide isomerase|nr:DsbA family protein [Gemmatimonadaceae bacterium]